MPWWVIPAIFGPILGIIEYCRRHPASRLTSLFFRPSGPTTDLSGATPRAARSSVGPYLVWGVGLLSVWALLSYLGISAKVIQFEEPLTLAVWFGSLLVGVTLLVAACTLWLRGRRHG
jgi:hypothetical protein